MRRLQLLFLMTLSLSCKDRQYNSKADTERYNTVPPAYVNVDTTDGHPFRTVIQEGKVIVPLSQSEIQLADSLLYRRIDQYNQNADKAFLIDLSKYKRQYFPSVDIKGQKKVELNCFCIVHDTDEWKHERVEVKDGGICYFNLTIDLTNRKISSFYVNGEA